MNSRSILVLLLLIFFLGACEKDKNNEETDDTPSTQTIETFSQARHAFGDSYQQSVEGKFQFPVDPAKVSEITMYIRLDCPSEGCNPWDVFANIRIWDEDTEAWYELGRYITPYGVDNSDLKKGFAIDVTDFKSLLTGDVKLKSYIEVWGSDGWLVSVDFEIEKGDPDYKYYAVAEVFDYADNSISGVPYGEDHDFCLEKNITIPDNTEETSVRTIITGWGHATPLDEDQRPCAEWCFRTHSILIDDAQFFHHKLAPLGCASNPVQPQNGNWEPDRAGWCPGMAVPVRKDLFDTPMNGESFSLEYDFEDWKNDMQSSADNKHAYYALSNYIIVKSNQPIEKPWVQ
ncbi:MAG: peptide-N-glycosidase F-related protein [Bacteroidota bacterium]